MRIRSQLTTPTVAVDRNLDNTVIDAVTNVNSKLPDITKLAQQAVVDDMAALADVDFTAIATQVNALEGLTVNVVETLPAGSQARAELVGNVIQLHIPKGIDGVDGTDGTNGMDGNAGYTPVKGVDYVDGADGYTPVKGVDYTDGKDGKDGSHGYSPIMEFTYNQNTGDIDYAVKYWSTARGLMGPSTVEWGHSVLPSPGVNEEW